MARPLEPSGTCWCGCGALIETQAFFATGHDSVAESAILDLKYGGRPESLAQHGYGPGQENLFQEVMRKYAPLAGHLAEQTSDRVELTLSEIEEIIGATLPRMAGTRDWWQHNGNRMHPHAWIEAGWDVEQISLARQAITFVREDNV